MNNSFGPKTPILSTARGNAPIGRTPPRIRDVEPAANIAGFFTLVQDAMERHLNTIGGPDGIIPILTEDFPQERLTKTDQAFEAITFRVQEMKMSPLSNDGTRIPRGIQVREVKSSTDKDTYNLIEASWFEDATVVFDIWSKSNANANKLVIWFHNFIYLWANAYKFFEGRGIRNFAFVKRMDDDTALKEGQEIYRRRVAYTFKLENLIKFEQRQITDITINVDFPAGSAPINLTSDSK